MKLFILSLALMISTISSAGGFRWPNVRYDHAKLYFMNIPWDEKERPEYHIYKDGIYALNKAGNGIDIPHNVLNEMHGIMARGMDELIYGLSKCFTPRHGIIYYDRLGNPVASISICLECSRFEFWSTREIGQQNVDSDKFNIDRAEEQMERFIELFKKNELPQYDNPKDYEALLDSSQLFKNNGEMNMDMTKRDTLFTKYFDKGQNWLWVHSVHKNEFEETVEMKITAGGDKISYNQFSDGKGTRFIYLNGNNHMTEATIISNLVTLPNGVKIGMSVDEVIGTFPIYDGIAWPEIINVEFDKYKVSYHFKRQTLVKIEMRSK